MYFLSLWVLDSSVGGLRLIYFSPEKFLIFSKITIGCTGKQQAEVSGGNKGKSQIWFHFSPERNDSCEPEVYNSRRVALHGYQSVVQVRFPLCSSILHIKSALLCLMESIVYLGIFCYQTYTGCWPNLYKLLTRALQTCFRLGISKVDSSGNVRP